MKKNKKIEDEEEMEEWEDFVGHNNGIISF